ncbi:MAG: cadherin domain-containing protein [Hyphomicrobiaceae bacterium]
MIGTLSAVDPNPGDTFTFTLLNDVGGRYQIVGNELQVGPAGLDYEGSPASPLVRVTDQGGLFHDEVVNIVVTDAPPTDVTVTGVLEVPENSLANTHVGLPLTVVDADATPIGAIFSYSLIDDAGGRFGLETVPGNPYQVQIVVALGTLLDYETDTSHQITLQVSNTGGTYQETFTVQVTDVNEGGGNQAPTSIQISNDTIVESSPQGTVIGLLSAADPNPGDTFTFTLLDDVGGRYQIVGNELQVGPSGLDFENPSSPPQIRVSDQGGLFFDAFVPIIATNAPPLDITGGPLQIDENAASFASVGLPLVVVDADPTPTGIYSFSLIDDAGGLFDLAIPSGPGSGYQVQVVVANGAVLDYETATSHDITVQVMNEGGTYQETFTIQVNDVAENSAPTNLTLTGDTIAENSVTGTVIGTVSASDPGDTITYTLDDSAGGRFQIVGNQLQVGPAANLDFETIDSHLITIRATDQGGLFTTLVVPVSVTNVTGNFLGDGNDNIFTGTSEEDLIQGLGGDDVLIGLEGADTLDGGANGPFVDFADYRLSPGGIIADLVAGTVQDGYGSTDTLIGIEAITDTASDDTITGDGNDNWFRLSDGTDNVDAGGGNDVVFYEDAPAGVVIDLVAGTASDGYGNTDTIQNFEAAHGGNFNDTISLTGGDNHAFGRGGNDTLLGLDGNDYLNPGSGSDTVDGGNGIDTLSYYTGDGADGAGAPTQGAVVDLVSGTASDPWGNTDQISNIENVEGSGLADSISGNAGNNRLVGGDGNDTLTGGGGFDQYIGGAGDDTLVGTTLLLDDKNDGNRADYSAATAGITATIGAASSVTGDASVGTDTLHFVETIVGTGFDDTFNVAGDFLGVYGNFVEVTGGDGNDIINGNGNTRASYAGANGAVEVNLAAGTAAARVGGPQPGATNIGSDTLTGVSQIRGSNFADVLIGSAAGGENFRGQAGDDLIDGGGGGNDRADYRNSSGGIVADLSTGIIQDGYGTTDTVTGIENVRGSEFDDTITGDANANRLEGRDGNDTLTGGGGVDTFAGGAGNDVFNGDTTDYADYSGDAIAGGTLGILVNQHASLTQGGIAPDTVIDAFGDTDTIVNVRHIIGTESADQIYGGGHSNILDGRGGDDYIFGHDGDDTLIGGAGNDTLEGGFGFDTFIAGAGDDTLVNQASSISGDGGRADYFYATSGITVVMGVSGGPLGEVTGDASVGTDTLDRVDQVTGSAFADSYTANASWVSTSGDAFNEFEGAGGDDTITGNGSTRVSYRTASDSVTVNLGAGTGTSTNPGDTAGVGNDTFTGVNAVRGSSFADTLIGSTGNDVFRGQGGADTIDGGSGADRADYSNSPGAIFADLGAGTIQDGWGFTDQVTSIERVRGSDFADTIRGNNANNILEGRDGDDSLRGRGGADTLSGGLGYDTADYAQDGAGVIVDLAAGTATDGVGATDTLSSIEQVRGSAHNDAITGTDFVGRNGETFRGLAGNDTITGGAGADEVRYDSDASFTDTGGLFGTAGVTVDLGAGTATDGFGATDTLVGIENVGGTLQADSLTGSDGNNVFRGLQGADTITGGDGYDETRYDRDEGFGGGLGVTVDLVNQTATDGWGDTDTLSGIEGARGTDFADTFIGNDVDNAFTGLDGADTIDGGAGSDEVRYDIDELRGGNLAVTVDLANGTATDGFGNIDTLIGIERVRGTAFNDSLTGDGNDNSFRGLAGDDTIDGAGGSDWVGYSRDYATFEEGDAPLSGVVVDLANGTATDSFGDTDTLISIENATGGALDDQLTGSSVDNSFRGLLGNDTIDGAGGNDTVDYSTELDFGELVFVDGSAGITVNLGAGTATDAFGTTDTLISIENVIGTYTDDTITGSSDSNVIDALGGNDMLTGGLGADTFVFRDSWGVDTITDFEDGTDSIDLTAFETISDVADLTITQDTLDVIISITGDPANTIRVENATVGQFTNADFDFFS